MSGMKSKFHPVILPKKILSFILKAEFMCTAMLIMYR